MRFSRLSIFAASRCASGTPRRRMPMKASLIQIFGLFQNFVSQTDQRPVDLRRTHELGFFAGDGHNAPNDRVSC